MPSDSRHCQLYMVVNVAWCGFVFVQHDTSTHKFATKLAGPPILRPSDRWGANHQLQTFLCGRSSVHNTNSLFPLLYPKFQTTSGMGGVKGNCMVAHCNRCGHRHVYSEATDRQLVWLKTPIARIKSCAVRHCMPMALVDIIALEHLTITVPRTRVNLFT